MPVKRFAVFCSGGGTDFQSLIDGVRKGSINAEICLMIASKPGIYAIERAREAGIPVKVICRKDYDTPEGFDEANRDALLEYGADFAVLAGYLNILGEKTVE